MTDFYALAERLQATWVGKGPYNYDAIRRSIASEMEANKKFPARCSAGCKRETRADAIRLGKVNKKLAVASQR